MSTSAGRPALLGAHHVTAICGDPQRNIDFWVGLLGLRLVKKTVNFDDPGTYHLYYGDGVGTPGTIMTFFAWAALPPLVRAVGRRGAGQIERTAFSIPVAAIDFWVDRLADANIDFETPVDRFGERVLALRDPDDLALELVAHPGARARSPWPDSPVSADHAIAGIRAVAITVHDPAPTARMLTGVLGFRAAGTDGDRHRFEIGAGPDTSALDLIVDPAAQPGRMGIGAVHHVAWRTPDRAQEDRWRERLGSAGFEVTPVRDRQYFESIYFNEPAGVLFEIATDPPGFTIDESVEDLGTGLRLPPWLEERRSRLETRLPEIGPPRAWRL